MRHALLTPYGLAFECDDPAKTLSAFRAQLAQELEFTPFLQVRHMPPNEVWLVRVNPIEELL